MERGGEGQGELPAIGTGYRDAGGFDAGPQSPPAQHGDENFWLFMLKGGEVWKLPSESESDFLG